MNPPTMPVTIPTIAPRNSRHRLARMWPPSSPSRARVHTTCRTSVIGGRVALLGWNIAQPAIHAITTATNGAAGSSRHAICPVARCAEARTIVASMAMRALSFPQQAPARNGEVLDRLHDQAVDDDVQAADD